MRHSMLSHGFLYLSLTLLTLCGCQQGEVEGDSAPDTESSQGSELNDEKDGAEGEDLGASEAHTQDVENAREGDASEVITELDSSGPSEEVQEEDIEAPSNPEEAAPVTQATHWCQAALGGHGGARAFAQDLAKAHVSQRLFGPSAKWLEADAKLISVLGEEELLGDAFLSAYSEAFEDICVLEAAAPQEEELSLEKLGTVALIKPGMGQLTLPQSAEVLIIDLRDNVSATGLRNVLTQALASDLNLATRRVRRFHGFPAQNDDWTHYEVSDASLTLTIEGEADKTRTLVLWTPKALRPMVATLVGGLRLLGVAHLAGHDLHAAVAESMWSGIGDSGLLWRASSLETAGARWPDVIEADIESGDLDELLEALEGLSSPASQEGSATRSDLNAYERGAGKPSSLLDHATMKAAFLVAYGTLDLFYAYFDLVGRDLDGALLEALDEVNALESGDRLGMKKSMGRFMHDLYDGHGFYWDDANESWPDGWMALQIQGVEGLPLIRTSLSPGINAGDTLVAVNGVDIESWYDEAMSRYSASSDGYRFVLATDELKEVYGSPQWTLRDPEGVERTLTLSASDYEDVEATPWGGTMRPNGWLTDMDAPDVYFVNMASAVTPDVSGVVAELTSAETMAGVVLDMRDYPYLDIYEFARNFNPEHFSAPLFGFPTWYGPWEYEVEFEAWEFDPAPFVVDVPVVLLVSNKSVSAAECFAQMVMTLDNVSVVGQQSASTNGTITTFWVPGRFELTFTGMRLTNPDASEFHAIGVVPDIEVIPTPEEFAAGIDPELVSALKVLGFGD